MPPGLHGVRTIEIASLGDRMAVLLFSHSHKRGERRGDFDHMKARPLPVSEGMASGITPVFAHISRVKHRGGVMTSGDPTEVPHVMLVFHFHRPAPVIHSGKIPAKMPPLLSVSLGLTCS